MKRRAKKLIKTLYRGNLKNLFKNLKHNSDRLYEYIKTMECDIIQCMAKWQNPYVDK